MAWTSKKEEAMYLVRLYLEVMKVDKKKELSELYSCLIFSRPRHSWSDVKLGSYSCDHVG